MLVEHVYVVCVVVDGVENFFYVVDVVDVVIVIRFMRVAEAVVPLCTNCSVNEAWFLVVALLFIVFVVVSVSGF